MANELKLKDGRLFKVGDRIRIVRMAYDNNYKGDKEATEKYAGREGEITYIGGDQLHGTWGGLAVIPDIDEVEMLG